RRRVETAEGQIVRALDVEDVVITVVAGEEEDADDCGGRDDEEELRGVAFPHAPRICRTRQVWRSNTRAAGASAFSKIERRDQSARSTPLLAAKSVSSSAVMARARPAPRAATNTSSSRPKERLSRLAEPTIDQSSSTTQLLGGTNAGRSATTLAPRRRSWP